MKQASPEVRPGDPYNLNPIKNKGVFQSGIGGTTTCIVADRHGNVVVATPSANVEDFDGGRTGVTYSNRLCSFNTTPGHPNCIQPGKRPRITLTPTLVLKNGSPILAISVAGGDLQDQTALELLLDFIEFGMLPEAAVTKPRFSTAHHQSSFNPNPDRTQAFIQAGSLTINPGINRETQAELARRGHKIEITPYPVARPVMLYINPKDGTFSAAGDPQTELHVSGL
jgi:gamma-glutamyltranspeptidase/glutathione hydrolase